MGAGEMGMGLRQWHWESECECEWHCQRTETNKRTSSKQANIPLPKVTQKTGNKNRKKMQPEQLQQQRRSKWDGTKELRNGPGTRTLDALEEGIWAP